nr:hypothetical protein BaRGS_016514 [Batillaria attramentaria]
MYYTLINKVTKNSHCLVTGIVILAIGIWTKVDLYKYLELSSIYQPEAPYVLIGVGAVIVVVGSLGCCCTIRGHVFLLYMLEKGFKEGLDTAINLYGMKGEEKLTADFDELQSKLSCCGITNYADWFESPWGREQEQPNTVLGAILACCLAKSISKAKYEPME